MPFEDKTALFKYPLSRLILGDLAVSRWGLDSPFSFCWHAQQCLDLGRGHNDFSTIKFFFIPRRVAEGGYCCHPGRPAVRPSVRPSGRQHL